MKTREPQPEKIAKGEESATSMDRFRTAAQSVMQIPKGKVDAAEAAEKKKKPK